MEHMFLFLFYLSMMLQKKGTDINFKNPKKQG